MATIKKIVQGLRKALTRPGERGEYSSGYLPQLVREKAVDVLKDTGERILDLGCGEGLLLQELSKKYPEKIIVGLDPWEEILSKAMARQSQNITLILGNSYNIPFKDETFDAVTCLNLFYNLPEKSDVIATLREMHRILKRGGIAVFDFRNKFNPIIFFGYKLAFLHDPDIKVPLRTHTFRWIKNNLIILGMKGISAYPLGFFLRTIAPTILILAKK